MILAEPTTPPPRPDPVPVRPPTTIMLSRVAAALYWMSRYLERAENIARLLDVNLQLLIDFGSIDDQRIKEHWVPVLRSAGDEDRFFTHYDKADSANVTEFMTFRKDNPNSVFSCVCAARENARQVRDQISLEMWEVLNECYLFLQSNDARAVWQHGPGAFYDQIKKFSHLFQGLTDSTFSRTEGWEFIQFGKYLERADKTTRILDVKYHILLPRGATDVGGAVDTAQWQAVLRSTSALEAYRRFYVTEILPRKVAEFLILSNTFPRSIRYCLEQLEESLQRIGGSNDAIYPIINQGEFRKLLADLDHLSIEDVIQRGMHEFLGEVQDGLDRIGAVVYEVFMQHPPVDLDAEIRLHQQEQQQQQQSAGPGGRPGNFE